MKNKEFFKEKIFEIACEHSKVAVVNGEPANCRLHNGCTSCDFYIFEGRCKDGFKDWLEKEHEEQKIQPEVKSLKKDDRVLISADGATWYKRYFKRYDEETGTVETYQDGRTSWSAEGLSSRWTYAKLPKLEEELEVENIDYGNNEFEIEEIAEETPENNNGWIPIDEDNIPDHEVLVCNRYAEELIGYIGKDESGFYCESDGEVVGYVTAWMEKPEPYKPEVQE